MSEEAPGPSEEDLSPSDLESDGGEKGESGFEAKRFLDSEKSRISDEWKAAVVESIEQSNEFGKNPLKPVIQQYYDGSSASHAVQCATNRVVYSGFMSETLQGVLESEESAGAEKEIAAEILPEVEFQNQLNSTLSQLMVADLLTYKQVHDPAYPAEKKIGIVDSDPKRERGSFPIVSRELQRLKSDLEKLQPQLRARLESLHEKYPDEFSENPQVAEIYERFIAETKSAGQMVEAAVQANDVGQASDLDIAMKRLVGHFADGAFVAEDVVSAHALRKMKEVEK
ncbi:MAG: hypothetical protein WD187_00750 [Candidatus Woykebacteria bacterium]